MDENEPVLLEIDRLIRLSRLREIEFIMSSDVNERMREITAALRRLPAGEYLLGTGPSTVGIVPLGMDEIILGRPPTILEKSAQVGADYCAADTLYFVPREVSRVHAKLIRQPNGPEPQHLLVDLNSTCGTFVNGMPVEPEGDGVVLRHGDVISLGPSQTSTYVYYRARARERTNREAQEISWVWVPKS